MATAKKPIILHLGDPVTHNRDIHERLLSKFTIINPPIEDLARPAFIRHLKQKTWGDFQAIMRPFWKTGGEMGRWDLELISLLPSSVKVFASAGAGFDWVDTQCLAERGIIYCNGAGASSEAVADMALYHIISVFRNMTWSHLAARSGSPQKFLHAHYCAPILSHNPRGHTLGIVGLGNIGLAIAKKVYTALGMKILYYDIARKPIAQEKEVHARFFHRLEDMLPLTDCLLLAAPYSGATLITSPILNALRPGARFVNIGRGSLVDEDALADALESGHLGAVGLDVHADEPHVSERLRRSWKVTVTSHTGGGAYETNVGFERLSMENVEGVLEGRGAKTPVNGHLIKGKGKGKGNGEEEMEKGIKEGEQKRELMRAKL